MRFLSTKIHAFMDYAMGVLLISVPFALGLDYDTAQVWAPMIAGAFVIIYSLFTDYELGITPQLSMKGHLVLDCIGGGLLAISPWIMGFANEVWLPHVLLGVAEIVVSFITRTVPSTHRMKRSEWMTAH